MASDTVTQLDDLSNEKKFYVYIYRDPRPSKNSEPIYVGKGSSKLGRKWRRADYHWLYGYNTNRLFKAALVKIRNMELSPLIEIIEWFDNESDALKLEELLIDRIGRRDQKRGPLLNLTNGGESGNGYIATPEALEKHRIAGELTWANASPELHDAMSKTRDMWKIPEIHAQRCANMKAVRAVKWSDLTIKTAHIEASRKTKLANSDKTSAQVKKYYATATPEKLAAHAKAISDSQSANAEKIGKTSSEVWSRPGMNEFISESIAIGQKSNWDDPVKGAQRREKLKATYARKRAEKKARELAEAELILKMDKAV